MKKTKFLSLSILSVILNGSIIGVAYSAQDATSLGGAAKMGTNTNPRVCQEINELNIITNGSDTKRDRGQGRCVLNMNKTDKKALEGIQDSTNIAAWNICGPIRVNTETISQSCADNKVFSGYDPNYPTKRMRDIELRYYGMGFYKKVGNEIKCSISDSGSRDPLSFDVYETKECLPKCQNKINLEHNLNTSPYEAVTNSNCEIEYYTRNLYYRPGGNGTLTNAMHLIGDEYYYSAQECNTFEIQKTNQIHHKKRDQGCIVGHKKPSNFFAGGNFYINFIGDNEAGPINQDRFYFWGLTYKFFGSNLNDFYRKYYISADTGVNERFSATGRRGNVVYFEGQHFRNVIPITFSPERLAQIKRVYIKTYPGKGCLGRTCTGGNSRDFIMGVAFSNQFSYGNSKDVRDNEYNVTFTKEPVIDFKKEVWFPRQLSNCKKILVDYFDYDKNDETKKVKNIHCEENSGSVKDFFYSDINANDKPEIIDITHEVKVEKLKPYLVTIFPSRQMFVAQNDNATQIQYEKGFRIFIEYNDPNVVDQNEYIQNPTYNINKDFSQINR